MSIDPHSLLDAYGRAVNARDAAAVAACFAPAHDYRVHGLGDTTSAWNEKSASTTAAIEEEYRRFFALVDTFEARYTDRIADLPGRAIACIVRVAGKNSDGTAFDMANALHLTFDEAGKIIVFHNWYGRA
ncbi:MAG: nuclear transport factor 2 family protein [Verrucomicrobiota bacterium JB024]|nr:nuclear transport factor 2 family protein [Verrucomicrobiota bacterium JB024]